MILPSPNRLLSDQKRHERKTVGQRLLGRTAIACIAKKSVVARERGLLYGYAAPFVQLTRRKSWRDKTIYSDRGRCRLELISRPRPHAEQAREVSEQLTAKQNRNGLYSKIHFAQPFGQLTSENYIVHCKK